MENNLTRYRENSSHVRGLFIELFKHYNGEKKLTLLKFILIKEQIITQLEDMLEISDDVARYSIPNAVVLKVDVLNVLEGLNVMCKEL